MSRIPQQALPEIRKKVLELAGPEDFEEAKTFLEANGGVEVATIQLAADPGPEVRAKIKHDLAKQGVLARIRIDRGLAGGARLFKGGMLKDASWKGRVRKLLSAIYA
ncbi:MAG TPA: hypothetical protein VMU11_03220 [Verrucomicrobiae bacterium]|nr:hypothetical protein [Verrucomicrobiae bacterium]